MTIRIEPGARPFGGAEMRLTLAIVSGDVEASRHFYEDILGGTVVWGPTPTIVQLANAWVTITTGGGPSEEKPDVTLEPTPDRTRVHAFLDIRVPDCQAVYEEWTARGGEFITPPFNTGNEWRCYIRDPDGNLIEVGEAIPAADRRITGVGA